MPTPRLACVSYGLTCSKLSPELASDPRSPAKPEKSSASTRGERRHGVGHWRTPVVGQARAHAKRGSSRARFRKSAHSATASPATFLALTCSTKNRRKPRLLQATAKICPRPNASRVSSDARPRWNRIRWRRSRYRAVRDAGGFGNRLGPPARCGDVHDCSFTSAERARRALRRRTS